MIRFYIKDGYNIDKRIDPAFDLEEFIKDNYFFLFEDAIALECAPSFQDITGFFNQFLNFSKGGRIIPDTHTNTFGKKSVSQWFAVR
jgi:hypothetical protein